MDFLRNSLEDRMSKRWKAVFAVAGITLLAAMLTAQDTKKGMRRGGGILHPELTVETGTWDAPAAKLGEKTDQTWSSTTVAAGVNSKPQPGRPITKVGEIVDFSCYIQLGKHGEKHRACGQKCVNNGQPIGLLTKEGMLYLVIPEEHDPRRDGGVDARPSASEHMGHIVEVTGTAASVNGYHAIYVAGLKK
jgi:hypothetical protein